MTLDELSGYVFHDLPGCPKPLIKQAAFLVFADFCRQTHAWKEDLTAINLVADQAQYSLTAPTGAVILMPSKVLVNDVQLSAPGGYTWNPSTGKVILTTAPSEAATGGLEVTVALAPATSVTTIADWITNHWLQVLVDGILAMLKKQQKKPWSDPAWQIHDRDYREAIGRAKAAGAIGYVVSEGRASFPLHV